MTDPNPDLDPDEVEQANVAAALSGAAAVAVMNPAPGGIETSGLATRVGDPFPCNRPRDRLPRPAREIAAGIWRMLSLRPHAFASSRFHRAMLADRQPDGADRSAMGL
jgi:hypothetical protein